MTIPGVIIALIASTIPVVFILSFLSTRYIRHLYMDLPAPRSWLFRALGISVSTQTIVGAYLSYVVIASLLRMAQIVVLPVFPPPWAAIVAGVAAIVLLSPPIYFAVTILVFRRRHKGVYHPDQSDGDVK